MRDRSIHIRVEHDDYEKILQQAGLLKMTLSAVAREIVLQGLSIMDRTHDSLPDWLECL